MTNVLLQTSSLLLEKADLARIVASNNATAEHKAGMGQFFTPPPVATFMASLFNDVSSDEVRLLDPGAGTGNLSAAFVDRLIRENTRTKLHIDAFESDSNIIPLLTENMSSCKQPCPERNISFNSSVSNRDFIESAVERLGLFGNGETGYTHCIMNPPYRKITSASKHRALLRAAGIETSNLYSAFVALSIKLLAPGGELVAIIPRSFCNGVYFKPFRNMLLQSSSLKQIHIFSSRSNAFEDEDVLQENVIIHLVKERQGANVTITSSTDAGLEDMTERSVPFEKVVNPRDSEQFIHIAASGLDQIVIDRIAAFDRRLSDLGLDVSTGPVVDFRLVEHIESGPGEGCPMIYSRHFQHGIVKWPLENSDKPNSIRENETTRQWLMPDGYYTLTRRFSSKEEARRIVPAIYRAGTGEAKNVGFENHINVYHENKQGIEPDIAKGMYVYLASTVLDMYFRIFSGHTQVNASDLRQIPYPGKEILLEWGARFEEIRDSQEQIDALVDKTLNEITREECNMNPAKAKRKISDATKILKALGLPRAQQNDRSALTLLALLDVKPETKWSSASAPLIGITPIMDYSNEYYGVKYAPNTRETFRRQTMHQFVAAGLALQNPDKPDRPVNSPKWVYQAAPDVLELVKTYGTSEWGAKLKTHLAGKKTLAEKYKKQRDMQLIPLEINGAKKLALSPGAHSTLIKNIIEIFGPRYAPGATVLYVGDTGSKLAHFDKEYFKRLGLEFDDHGKFPDVVLYCPEKNWLFLIESVTSHGPVDSKRHDELQTLFGNSKAGLVFVTAFPNRRIMAKYLPEISWETEVWSADAPSHIIHFNGERFLGPYTGQT